MIGCQPSCDLCGKFVSTSDGKSRILDRSSYYHEFQVLEEDVEITCNKCIEKESKPNV